jgi:hypothetical protein
LRPELVDMLHKGFITCTVNKEIQSSMSSNSSALTLSAGWAASLTKVPSM